MNCSKQPGVYEVPNNDFSSIQYDSFWKSVYFLLGIFITFRLMVIVSLKLQDTKFGDAPGDTRNRDIGQGNARDRTVVAI